jgi:hypothetical protein
MSSEEVEVKSIHAILLAAGALLTVIPVNHDLRRAVMLDHPAIPPVRPRRY